MHPQGRSSRDVHFVIVTLVWTGSREPNVRALGRTIEAVLSGSMLAWPSITKGPAVVRVTPR
jgi:hypothetical protein